MRTGMTEIVAYLRQYGQVGENESWNEIVYWTDDQLEEVADRNAVRAQVRLVQANWDATIYNLQLTPNKRVEDTFTIRSDDNVVVDTVATYSPIRNEVVFASALTDERYWLEALQVDLYMALSDLWGVKAQQRYDYINFKAGENKMDMQQEYNHCIQMQELYRQRIAKRWRRPQGRFNV